MRLHLSTSSKLANTADSPTTRRCVGTLPLFRVLLHGDAALRIFARILHGAHEKVRAICLCVCAFYEMQRGLLDKCSMGIALANQRMAVCGSPPLFNGVVVVLSLYRPPRFDVWSSHSSVPNAHTCTCTLTSVALFFASTGVLRDPSCQGSGRDRP